LVGALAGALSGSAPLGVLPGGRGNDFARKLDIPFDPVEAVRLLETGREARVDLALVADGAFPTGAASGRLISPLEQMSQQLRHAMGQLMPVADVHILDLHGDIVDVQLRPPTRAQQRRLLLGPGDNILVVKRAHDFSSNRVHQVGQAP
jgi:hypothetical protein